MFIIYYHNVIEGVLDEFDKKLPRIKKDQFLKEIKFLFTNYEIISLSKAINKTDKKNNKQVVLTFDDGCKGFLLHALPILKEFNIPATIFIVTDFTNNVYNNSFFDRIEIAFRLTKKTTIDLSFLNNEKIVMKNIEDKVKYMKNIKRKLKLLPLKQRYKYQQIILNQLDVEIPEMYKYVRGIEKYQYLSWKDLEIIKQAGYEIGSHTHRHYTLNTISEKDLELELKYSYDLIKEKLDIEKISLAYPHGTISHIGNLAPVKAKEIGYSCALTTMPGNNEFDNLFLLKRVTFEEFSLYSKISKLLN